MKPGWSLLPAILALAFALHPQGQEHRAACLVFVLLLGLLAGLTWRRSAALHYDPMIVLSLVVSLACFSSTLVKMGRQVRAQRNLTQEQKRAHHLSYQVGLRWAEIQQAQSLIPEDAHGLLLWNAQTSAYTRSLVNYYLLPRRLYHWKPEDASHVDERGEFSLPDLEWLQERHIGWLVILEGEKGNRLRVLPCPR